MEDTKELLHYFFDTPQLPAAEILRKASAFKKEK